MISAYLVHTGMTAVDALNLFGAKRTANNKGVTIPRCGVPGGCHRARGCLRRVRFCV